MAIAPDETITISFFEIKGFRYKNSEAYSTSTGVFAIPSIKYSPTSPACQEVPQAIMDFINFCKKI